MARISAKKRASRSIYEEEEERRVEERTRGGNAEAEACCGRGVLRPTSTVAAAKSAKSAPVEWQRSREMARGAASDAAEQPMLVRMFVLRRRHSMRKRVAEKP